MLTDRDLALVRAALERARWEITGMIHQQDKIARGPHTNRKDRPLAHEKVAMLTQLRDAIRALDPAAIVASVKEADDAGS